MNIDLNKTEITLIRNSIQSKIYALLNTAEDVDYPDVLKMRIKVVLDMLALDEKLMTLYHDDNTEYDYNLSNILNIKLVSMGIDNYSKE